MKNETPPSISLSERLTLWAQGNPKAVRIHFWVSLVIAIRAGLSIIFSVLKDEWFLVALSTFTLLLSGVMCWYTFQARRRVQRSSDT